MFNSLEQVPSNENNEVLMQAHAETINMINVQQESVLESIGLKDMDTTAVLDKIEELS